MHRKNINFPMLHLHKNKIVIPTLPFLKLYWLEKKPLFCILENIQIMQKITSRIMRTFIHILRMLFLIKIEEMISVNNQNGMFKSVLPIVATGVAILGIVRGMRSRSFKPFLQTILSSLSFIAPAAQNILQPLQGMRNNQGSQQRSADPKNPIR